MGLHISGASRVWVLSVKLLSTCLCLKAELTLARVVSLFQGRYDARARVLICHMTSLLRVPLGELDLLEETFLESLKETKEEESE